MSHADATMIKRPRPIRTATTGDYVWNGIYLFVSGDVPFELAITEESSGNDSPFKIDPMTPFVDQIKEFAYLEEDDDFTPVPQIVIDNAIVIVQKIFARDDEKPYWIVPTRSAGIALDYRIGGRQVYYVIEPDGSMKVTILQGYDILDKRLFTNVYEVATPDELLHH